MLFRSDEFGAHLPTPSATTSTPRRAGPTLATDDGTVRQAGYALLPSPLTPSRRAARESGPKIVHLGPVRPLSPSGSRDLFGGGGGGGAPRSFSPSGRRGGGLGAGRTALALAKDMLVESPVLVRATLRRVRVAQALLGYPLLPLAAVSSVDSAASFGEIVLGEADAEGLVRAWSRGEAVEALVQETKDLIDEWREDEEFEAGDDSGILVDMEEPPRSPRSGQP